MEERKRREESAAGQNEEEKGKNGVDLDEEGGTHPPTG